MTFTKAQIDEMRADVAKGAGHECDEWWADGRCQLCDRVEPDYELRLERLVTELQGHLDAYYESQGQATYAGMCETLRRDPGELLRKLNNDERGEIALAVSVEDHRLVIQFGKNVNYLKFDKAHLDVFLATLHAKSREL